MQLQVLMNGKTLLSQIEEVGADIGQPDCKLVEPVVICDDGSLEPWLLNLTMQNEMMISSDKILTVVEPTSALLSKYNKLFD